MGNSSPLFSSSKKMGKIDRRQHFAYVHYRATHKRAWKVPFSGRDDAYIYMNFTLGTYWPYPFSSNSCRSLVRMLNGGTPPHRGTACALSVKTALCIPPRARESVLNIPEQLTFHQFGCHGGAQHSTIFYFPTSTERAWNRAAITASVLASAAIRMMSPLKAVWRKSCVCSMPDLPGIEMSRMMRSMYFPHTRCVTSFALMAALDAWQRLFDTRPSKLHMPPLWFISGTAYCCHEPDSDHLVDMLGELAWSG